MKAKEVRIGNILKKDGVVVTIDGRSIFDMWCAKFYAENYDPIPLTEEWLLRFGFEKSVEHTWSFGYNKEFNVFRLNNLTYNGLQAAWWYNLKLLDHQPEYVHQLQNLFFALNGKELQLRANKQPDNTTPHG